MKTFVLGAGASAHVGYPLTSDLWTSLVSWMAARDNDGFRQVIMEAEKVGSDVRNVELLFTELPPSTRQSLRHAISGFFNGIRSRPAPAYRLFAEKCVQAGDTIISFNYDVSMELELKRAMKWEVGNGYGFDIPGSMPDSPLDGRLFRSPGVYA